MPDNEVVGNLNTNVPGDLQNSRFKNELDQIDIQSYSNLTLILTDKCNLRCVYCYEQNSIHKPRTVMSWETARKALDMFYSQVSPRTVYTSISLFGGEPHLAFDTFKKTVEYTINHRTIGGYTGNNFNYSTNTNGTILTPEIFDLYSRLGKKINVRLSIDGYRENHDLTRVTAEGHGSWTMLEKNLGSYMRLRDEYGVNLTAVTTINKSNYNDMFYNLTEIYELTGISYIAPLVVHEEKWTDEDFDAIIEQVSKLYDYGRKNRITFPICQIGPQQSDGIYICSSGLSSYIVDFNGEIYPCHRCYFYDVGKFYRMGNIETGISPSKRRMMYEVNNMKNMPRRCNECYPTIRARCHICFATNTVAYGDPFNIPVKFCMFQKQMYYMLVEKWKGYRGRSFEPNDIDTQK